MAFNATRAVISFVVDGVQAGQRQINQLGGSISELGTMAGGSLKALAGFAGVGLGLGALAKEVMDAQREFDKLNASLVTATGSTASAGDAFEALQSFAATTPYSLKEATEAFLTMRNLGLDPSEKALRSYGNTAAAMGKDLSQMVEAVADAASGEFERLKEFGITAAKSGDQVALTFQGMTTKIGNNTKDIQGYLQKLGDVNFGGAMEKRAATLDGAISNLGDTWTATMRTIAQHGIGDEMQSGVIALSNSLNDFSAILDVVGGAAKKEGESVSEASVLHASLTAVFETLAVSGVNLAYVLTAVGKDAGALAATAVSLAKGDFAAAKAIANIRRADAEEERRDVDTKSAAILGAAAKAQKAAADEVGALAKIKAAREAGVISAEDYEKQVSKLTADRLGKYAIELNAEQKRAKAKQDIFDIENKLNGTNAQTSADLAKLKIALDTGAISASEYAKYVAKINKETIESSTAYKDQLKQMDLSTAGIKRRLEAQALLNQREQEHTDFLRNSGQLNEEDAIKRITALQVKDLIDQKSAAEGLLVLAKKKIDNQREQQDLAGQIGTLNTKISDRQKKEEEDLFLLEQKYYRVAADNFADVIENARGEAKAQQDALRDQKEANAELGMTDKQIAEVTATRLLDQAALKDEAAELAAVTDASGLLSQAYRDQAEALRGRADLTIFGSELKQQKELWATVESTAHDTFISIFDSGKSAFDRLRDTLKNGLLELLYQMVIKKWVLNIGASVGLTGASSLAQAGDATGVAGLASGSTGLIGLAQSASNVYKAVTGGFSSLSGSVADAIQLGFDKTGLAGIFESAAPSVNVATGITGNGAAATMGGSVAGIAAGVLGGLLGGNLISGQYGSKATVGVGTAVGAIAGSVVPVIGTAIGSLVGGLLGGIGNRLFGMGNKEVTSTGLKGTLSDSGLSGSSYQKWKQDGGWFRSDKSGTDTTAFTGEVSAQFTQGFATIKAASAGFAASIGASTDSLANYSKTFDIAITSDATANEKAVTEFFTGVGDEIALRLVPGLAQFNKYGETMSTTLQRLAGDFDATNQVAMLMGKTGATMFGSLGIDSAAAREQLIAMAGGVSVLSSQATSFAQNYLTEAQRLAPVAAAVGTAMASLGLASITTRDQFAGRVDQLISSGAILTQAGAQEYTSLMALADAFAQVHPAIDSTAAATKTAAQILTERTDLEKQLNELTMTAAQLAAARRDDIAEENRGLYDQVKAAQAAKDANDAAKSSLADFLTSTKAFATSVSGFNNNLLTGSLSTLTPEDQLAEARRQFEQTKAAVLAGDTTAQGNLSAIENTFLTLSQKLNGGDAQYSSDMASVMQANDQIAQWATGQVSVAQASLDALNAQVGGITTLNMTMASVAQNLQYLPQMTGATSLPNYTPPSLPTIDFSNYGTASQAPLLAEIKAMREEIKAFRADAQQQTADKLVVAGKAAMAAADRVVEGVGSAIDDAVNNISSNKVDLSDF